MMFIQNELYHTAT